MKEERVKEKEKEMGKRKMFARVPVLSERKSPGCGAEAVFDMH